MMLAVSMVLHLRLYSKILLIDHFNLPVIFLLSLFHYKMYAYTNINVGSSIISGSNKSEVVKSMPVGQ